MAANVFFIFPGAYFYICDDDDHVLFLRYGEWRLLVSDLQDHPR